MRQPQSSRLGLALVVVLSQGLAAQDLPRRIDCGDLNGLAEGEPGFELLSETSTPAGIVLTPPALDTVHVGYAFPDLHGTGTPLGVLLPVDVLAADPDELAATHRMTALELADDSVLGVTGLVPARLHRVELELGALYPWYDLDANGAFAFSPSVSRAVRVEVFESGAWRDAVHDVRCSTGWQGHTLATDVGSIVTVWITARSDDQGRVRVRLSTDGGDPVFLAGLSVHAHEPLPIRHHRTAAGPLEALDPVLVPFAAAMAARDYDAAEQFAAGVAKAFPRGVARLFLAGWLDGTRDGRMHLLPLARADLEIAAATHPAVPWLIDQLDDFERALLHLRASGYESARACPSEGGTGFLNETCGPRSSLHAVDAGTNPNTQIALRALAGLTAPMHGETLLHDLAAFHADDPSTSLLEPSPLALRALALTAETIVDLSQLVLSESDPEAVEMGERAAAIVQAFLSTGSFDLDVPDEIELLLYARFVETGQHPRTWSLAELAEVFSADQLAHAWWADETAAPAPTPGAPAWVDLQLHQRALHEALTRYWLGERVRDHELGGGWGDDVELLAQLALPYIGLHGQGDRRELDGLHELVRYGLDEQGDVQGGYYSGGPTDVEHSAEYTTNTWYVERGLHGLTPRMARSGLDVVRHVLRDDDPSLAFCGTTTKGRLHFKSFVFTGDGPSDDPAYALDVLQDGRALVPGVGLASFDVLPQGHRSRKDLRRLADALRDDAEDTAGAKPQGWFAPTRWPSNAFGEDGIWYSEKGSVSDAANFSKTMFAYGLELLRLAWRDTGDWTYLVPVARLFRAVATWEAADSPGGPAGSSAWVAAQTKAGARFGPLVIASLDDLASEPALQQVDPLTGKPYVDAALLDAMRTWVEVEFTGQTNVLRYALGGVAPCGHGGKPTNSLWAPYENVIAYMRVAWPLLGKHVLHTDRAFFGYQGGGPQTLLAGATGEVLVEGIGFLPLVRWNRRFDDGEGLAVLCNDRAYDRSTYGAFVWNTSSEDAELELVLDTGLRPGRYRVSWDAQSTGCDSFPVGAVPQSLVVQKRGATAVVGLSVVPGRSLVRIERLGDAAGPPTGWDLAVDPPRVVLRKAPGGPRLDVEIVVANVGATAAPASSLELRLAFLFADGHAIPLPGLPTELLLGSFAVNGLAGAGDWSLASQEVVVSLPVDALLAAVLTSGLGLSLRAQLVSAGGQGDLANDDQTRAWFLPQIEIVPAGS